MKILQIIYSLSSGGGERFVVDLCNELVLNVEDDIYLLTINDDKEVSNMHYYSSLSSQVKYLNIGAKSGLSLKAVWGVYKKIKEINPDVVHLHCSLILLFLPVLLLPNVKYFHTLHSIAEKCISFQWLKNIQKVIYRKKVVPITISKYCNDSFRLYYGLDNAICIENGRSAVGVTTKSKIVSDEIQGYVNVIESRMINKQKCPVFVHVARYAKEKNQTLLFDSFNRLSQKGFAFLLIVIGNNYQNSPYKNFTSDCIKILGEKKNVGDYLVCSNYFVLSSLYEGLPLSLLEAMSVGCVPISTPAGGVVDVIENGTNGYVSPSFGEEDFYNTILTALSHDYHTLSANAVNTYQERFSMTKCALSYKRAYLK